MAIIGSRDRGLDVVALQALVLDEPGVRGSGGALRAPGVRFAGRQLEVQLALAALWRPGDEPALDQMVPGI